MANADPKSFLSRWARRKLAATLDRQPDAEAASGESPVENPKSDADNELRRLALRALFREPEFAVRDGLDDYDGDYTLFEARGEVLTQDMLRALERTQEMLASAGGEVEYVENQAGTAHPTEIDMNAAGERSIPESGD